MNEDIASQMYGKPSHADLSNFERQKIEEINQHFKHAKHSMPVKINDDEMAAITQGM